MNGAPEDSGNNITPRIPGQDNASLDLRLNEAVEHHRAGRLFEAEEIYRGILDADAGHPQALCLLGVIAHATGENEQALELITRAIAAKPDYADAHGNLGMVLQAVERSEEALESFNTALTLNPNYAEALNNKGAILKELGRLDEAVACYRKAIEIMPDYADAHGNLGNAQLKIGMAQDAIESYQRALTLNPNHVMAHVNMGIALNETGSPGDGLRSIRQALTIEPGQAMALAAAGGILFEQKKFDEASHHFKQAADKDSAYECGRLCFPGDEFNEMADLKNFDRLVSALTEITGTFPSASGAGPVVMTSCDHGYFQQFGPALALSVDLYAPGHDFHLHVINPDPSFDDEIATLEQQLHNTVLTVTTETTPGADRMYFPAVRFVRLYQLLERTGRDFLHLDTDSLVHGPLTSLAEIDAGADLSIPTRFDEIPFKNKVLISSLFIHHTPVACRFMRYFASYLTHCLTDNELFWALDQAAFYVVYRMMAFNGEAVSLASMPKALCDHDFGNDSDIWAAKGNRKLNNAYVEECARLLGS